LPPLGVAFADDEVGAHAGLEAELLASTLTEPSADVWTLTIVLAGPHDLQPGALYAQTSATGSERLLVDAGVWSKGGVAYVRVPLAELADGDPLVLSVRAPHPVIRSEPDLSATLYLALEGGQLVLESFEQHIARISDQAGALRIGGPSLEAPPELAHLPPWDNPALPDDARAIAEALRAELEGSGALTTSSTALTAGATGDSDVEPAAGCAAGGDPATPWLVLTALGVGLLAVRRLRGPGAAALATLVLIVPSPAEAQEFKVVYGYVAFWDSRPNKSDLSGSRLLTCDTGNTTCGPADGASCCFRGIPHVGVYVNDPYSGAVLAETITSQNGFFVMTFYGDSTTTYPIRVRYKRAAYPGWTRLALHTTLPSSWPQPASAWPVTQLLKLAPLTSQYNYFPRLAVNSAGDTTQVAGNVATVWATVTQTQVAIAAEGDTRYRRSYGASDTDPDDLTLIRYTWYKPHFPHCEGGWFNTHAEIARDLWPARLQGYLYQGRVVDCEAWDLGIANYPKFPPNPGVPAHSFLVQIASEGVAMAHAPSMVTSWLSRWDPETTTLSDMRNVLSVECVDTLHRDNSNDATSVRNTALALWEFIDADTSGANGGVDDTNITMKGLMDGLYFHSLVSGSPGQNHTNAEPYYTATLDPCDASTHDNEQCDPGDACLHLPGAIQQCYTGDPHGANIYDTILWTALLAGFQGWPGAGDFISTLDSSPCLGEPRNSYEFDGGYRTD